MRIAKLLRALAPDDIATSIISFEEQSRGWLAGLSRATTMERQLSDYGELSRLLKNYCDIAVAEFDSAAAREFERLRSMRLRVGTMDLEIAAIALARNATLLSRNLADFRRIPGLSTEDSSA